MDLGQKVLSALHQLRQIGHSEVEQGGSGVFAEVTEGGGWEKHILIDVYAASAFPMKTLHQELCLNL